MRMRSLLAVLMALGVLNATTAAWADEAVPTAQGLAQSAVASSPSERKTDRPDDISRPVAPRAVDRVDLERETLARLAGELLLLQAEVHDAARSAPTMARVQFRYDWLESDLELIERGIRDHLDAPRQPRAVAPLKGDYRR
jgi:RAQPRD family integrative conjugative element protein